MKIYHDLEQGSLVPEGQTKTTVKPGDVILNLTILRRHHQNKDGRWIWECSCKCGKLYLKSANQIKATKFGYCSTCCEHPNKKHGMRKSKVWAVWSGMNSRCNNKSHKSFEKYGGRGITVCERWKNFESFYEDMGEPPDSSFQIDRIDNNLGYSPENCQWATRSQNQRNRSNSKLWIRDGIEYPTLESMAKAFGVSIQTAHRWCVGGKDDRRGTEFKNKTNCESKLIYENL